MPTLADLVADLGPYVLSVGIAPPGLDVPVGSVVIYDHSELSEAGEGDLVLGVGLLPGAVLERVIEKLGTSRAAGLVLKSKDLPDSRSMEAAQAAQLALLVAPPSCSWAQLVALIRTALTQTAFQSSLGPSPGLAMGDLFGIANAIAGLVDAPVTIEDTQSRVIAYSGWQEKADSPRIETILGRRVPEEILRRLYEDGVFDRLARSREPVYFEPGTASDMAREAVAIRAGDEIVGSIWAAVKQPLAQDRRRALADAANLVALHLAKSRLDADVARRIQAHHVVSLLEGAPDARQAAEQLGLTGRRFRIVAAWAAVDREAAEADILLLRLWDLLSFHLSTSFRPVATALLGGTAYAIVPCSSSEKVDREKLTQALNQVLSRADSLLDLKALAAAGGPATLADVPRSRAEAEQAVRVLRHGRLPRRFTMLEEVRMQVLLLRLSDLMAGDESLRSGPLELLAAHDRRRHTRYVGTLRGYLDNFGDVSAAAAQLHVHPNTFRYRLRKLQEVADVRLDEPEERLMMMLQLRLLQLQADGYLASDSK
ncbi:MAG: helix-turn-helix domain-containing protein [Actinomycetota bacterium]|nr:helix-turn-helix domain-containing protein [Actinomycetota bacterium]